MNKKLYTISLLLSIIFIFSGCKFNVGSYSVENFSVTKKKPYNFYYTNLLAKNLTLETNYKINVIDTNFYKDIKFSSEDISTVKTFINALRKDNFLNEKPADLPEKPYYKIFLSFNKEKYVMNVYNEKYISIYPYDGSYPMDFLNIDGIYASCNIYSLCKYLIPKK